MTLTVRFGKKIVTLPLGILIEHGQKTALLLLMCKGKEEEERRRCVCGLIEIMLLLLLLLAFVIFPHWRESSLPRKSSHGQNAFDGS
jgi:hypothetical protein